MSRRKYDSTIARIAGNILSGVLLQSQLTMTGKGLVEDDVRDVVRGAVKLARMIVVETQATEPKDE